MHMKFAGESGAVIGAERSQNVGPDEEEENSALFVVKLTM